MAIELRKLGGKNIGCIECGCDHGNNRDICRVSVAEVIEWLGAVEVPWCAEHDLPMDTWAMASNTSVHGWLKPTTDCRLEEPARHYKIGAQA